MGGLVDPRFGNSNNHIYYAPYLGICYGGVVDPRFGNSNNHISYEPYLGICYRFWTIFWTIFWTVNTQKHGLPWINEVAVADKFPLFEES